MKILTALMLMMASAGAFGAERYSTILTDGSLYDAEFLNADTDICKYQVVKSACELLSNSQQCVWVKAPSHCAASRSSPSYNICKFQAQKDACTSLSEAQGCVWQKGQEYCEKQTQ